MSSNTPFLISENKLQKLKSPDHLTRNQTQTKTSISLKRNRLNLFCRKCLHDVSHGEKMSSFKECVYAGGLTYSNYVAVALLSNPDFHPDQQNFRS